MPLSDECSNPKPFGGTRFPGLWLADSYKSLSLGEAAPRLDFQLQTEQACCGAELPSVSLCWDHSRKLASTRTFSLWQRSIHCASSRTLDGVPPASAWGRLLPSSSQWSLQPSPWMMPFPGLCPQRQVVVSPHWNITAETKNVPAMAKSSMAEFNLWTKYYAM